MANVRINYIVDKSQVDAADSALKDLNRTENITEKETKQLANRFREANTDAGRMKRGINDAGGELRKFNNLAQNAGKLIVGVFAAQQLIQFVKGVVEVTGKFQTFEAVLTNTLGSNSKAKKSLDEITKFAAKTPFAVDQLTQSFVKLANQGFIPTTNQLRQLGDLASSVGKDFDQLTEALIDAQVGEFERLKEFGIRAQKEGDKVTFTFKGVQQQVDFTNESIQGYILSLGDLEGVSGSMAAISETVSGKISNLGDNFTQLQKNIGDSSGGLIASILDLANDALGVLNTAFGDTTKLAADFNDVVLNQKGISGRKLKDAVKPITDLADKDFYDNLTQTKNQFISLLTAEGEGLADATEIWNVYFKQRREGRQTLDEAIQQRIERIEDEKEAEKLAFEQSKKQYLESLALLRELGKISRVELNTFEGYSKKVLTEISNLSEELFGEQNDGFKTAKDRLKELVGDALEGEAKITKGRREQEEERKKIDEEEGQRRADIINASVGLTLSAADSIVAIQNNRSQQEINTLQQQKDAELAITGLTEEQKASIQARFDAQILEKRREQARREKALSLFNIAVQTAENAIRLFALTVPPGILSAVAIGVGAVQAGAVASQPLPFNKGTKRVPGSGNTDTVPAILTPGEKVFNVATSNAYGPSLDAIFDRKIRPEVINSFVKNGGSQVVVNNDMREVAKAIKGQPKKLVTIDKRGFTAHQISETQRIEKKLNRYKG